MNHVMIDLETLSIKPNAMILTIGAVQFDPNLGEIGDKFYQRIDIMSYEQNFPKQSKTLFDINPSTIIWWMNQSEFARIEAFLSGPRLNIREVLLNLVDWLRKISLNGKIVPWSHGKDFDLIILQNYFEIFGIFCPWKFWESRDTRTLYDLMSINMREIQVPEGEVAHTAIGDCLKQINGVFQAYKKLPDKKPLVKKLKSSETSNCDHSYYQNDEGLLICRNCNHQYPFPKSKISFDSNLCFICSNSIRD